MLDKNINEIILYIFKNLFHKRIKPILSSKLLVHKTIYNIQLWSITSHSNIVILIGFKNIYSEYSSRNAEIKKIKYKDRLREDSSKNKQI